MLENKYTSTDKCPTIYGPSSASRERDDISRSCILLPSNSRKPIFHNFQVHLFSLLAERERGSKGLSSRHDLLVDEAGNFGQFEFFPEKKKGWAVYVGSG